MVLALGLGALAGLLMGGGLACYRQRRPVWLPVGLFAVSLVSLWWAATLVKAAQ